jgi:hypothetical protein
VCITCSTRPAWHAAQPLHAILQLWFQQGDIHVAQVRQVLLAEVNR